MAVAGTTITSPPVRQTITFVTTAADSDGEVLELEAVMAPGSFIPPHGHLCQREDWRVLDGAATFRIDGQTVDASAGEKLTVAPRTPHSFRNRSKDDVRLRVSLSPALRAEDLFSQLFELGAQHKVNRLGAPSPRTTARLIREFRHTPIIKRSYGWGLLPRALNRSPGRRLAQQTTGRSWLPLLLTATGETITGSEAIKAWAHTNPQQTADSDATDMAGRA